jgi:hypothetical protein
MFPKGLPIQENLCHRDDHPNALRGEDDGAKMLLGVLGHGPKPDEVFCLRRIIGDVCSHDGMEVRKLICHTTKFAVSLPGEFPPLSLPKVEHGVSGPKEGATSGSDLCEGSLEVRQSNGGGSFLKTGFDHGTGQKEVSIATRLGSMLKKEASDFGMGHHHSNFCQNLQARLMDLFDLRSAKKGSTRFCSQFSFLLARFDPSAA